MRTGQCCSDREPSQRRMASITRMNRNEISPMGMTAHVDLVEGEQAKWSQSNKRQKGAREKNIEMKARKKAGRSAEGTEEENGMALEWNAASPDGDGSHLHPLTRCKSAFVYLPTPESGPPRFPDAPIPLDNACRRFRRTYLETCSYGGGLPFPRPCIRAHRTPRGCPPRMSSVSSPLDPHDPDPGPMPTPRPPQFLIIHHSLPRLACVRLSSDILPFSSPFCISQSGHRGTPDCRNRRFPPDLSPMCDRLSLPTCHAAFGSRCCTFDAASWTSTTVSQSSWF